MATPTLPATGYQPDTQPTDSAPHQPVPGYPDSESPTAARVGGIALNLLRLALGVEFLWAFLDKTFGLGYATPAAKAWIDGGSPTKGFLSGVSAGPLREVFNAIAGNPIINWLFMLGLLGIGLALLLGVALRIAAVSGAVLLMMMWFASWPPATVAGGEPTGSTNPVIDDHIISAIAIIVVGAFAVRSAGYLGRAWRRLDLVQHHHWLR